ncbi:hypothetical protein [Amycolatopsis jiangsuensis]|uniref:Uncharacterized protein n=1 Tax=Amycolatopsis jiangsuensis TaxID=1181879 RepID=A0A840IU16_9PSEU|nr:hypothetical protein [Amycolatopsis jiangsuensis]MBB4685956.1 hypothetical protein [Amycolatopsis jiangsuensis]
MATRAARILSPALFLLAGMLLLFLPSVAVSCDVPIAAGTHAPAGVHVTYSGAAVIGDRPQVETSGAWARTQQWEDAYSSRSKVMDPLVRGLAVGTLVVLAAGMATALLRSTRGRVVTSAVLAATGIVLVVVTEVLAKSALETAVRNLVGALVPPRPGTDFADVLAHVGDAVHLRSGLWATTAGLAVIAALNVVALVRQRKSPSAPAAGHAIPDGQPDGGSSGREVDSG